MQPMCRLFLCYSVKDRDLVSSVGDDLPGLEERWQVWKRLFDAAIGLNANTDGRTV